MAKVLFTAVVADMRNKLNGTVFSKNRSGAYVRTKVSPVNAQTSDQTIVRQRLASLSAQWRGLTESQRNGWIAATEYFPRTDQFGNTYLMSGLSLFVSLNTNNLTIGEAVLTDAPAPREIPEFNIVSVTADESASTVSVALSEAVPANFALVLQATAQQSAGVNFFKNKYRQIGVFAAATATPVAIGTEYEAKFGNIISGQKISVRGYLICVLNGQAGIPTTADTIAVG